MSICQDRYHLLDKEEEENTGMENLTDGQKRAREATARFANPGETFLGNDRAQPYYEGQSLEEVKALLKKMYPDFDLRFDTEHVVDGFGTVCTSDESNISAHEDPRQVNFAVYGKPKSG